MNAQSQLKRIDFEDGVWGEVVRDFYNPIIKRREITMIVHHVLKPTPMRINLRLTLAEKLGVDIQRVYIRKIQSEYGIGRSLVVAHIYDTIDRVKAFEPEYIIERNGGINPFEEE